MDKTIIEQAFIKYGSDKMNHGYADFYCKHLPDNPKNILEIGVKEGASLLAWKEIFPNSIIHGLDLFLEFPVPTLFTINHDSPFHFHKGNQTDQYILEQLRRENFDVIIEDASHDCRKHWITMWGLINSCGQYYIEDLHTCKDEFFREGLSYEQTILSCAKDRKLPFDFVLSENEKIILICQQKNHP